MPCLFMLPTQHNRTTIGKFFILSLPSYQPTNRLWPALTNQNYTKCIFICVYTNQSKLYNLETSFTWNGLSWELWVGNFFIRNDCFSWAHFGFLPEAAAPWFSNYYLNKVSSFPFQWFLLDLFTCIYSTEMKSKDKYKTFRKVSFINYRILETTNYSLTIE